MVSIQVPLTCNKCRGLGRFKIEKKQSKLSTLHGQGPLGVMDEVHGVGRLPALADPNRPVLALLDEGQHRGRDVVGRLRRENLHHGAGVPAHRRHDGLADLLLDFGDQLRHRDPRAHDDHPHPGLVVQGRQGLAEPEDGVLRRGVHGQEEDLVEADDGRDVHDHAALAAPVLPHVLERQHGAADQGVDVEVDRPLPVVVVQHAGVVDEDVEAPERVDDPLERGLQLVGLRQVAGEENGAALAELVLQGGRRLLALRRRQVHHGDALRAVAEQYFGVPVAQPGRRPGDHHRFVLHVIHRGSFVSLVSARYESPWCTGLFVAVNNAWDPRRDIKESLTTVYK